MKKYFLLLLLLTPLWSQAKCVLTVDRLNEVASELDWKGINGKEDDTAIIRSDFSANLSPKGAVASVIDYEAFIRPDKDGSFQLLPVPFFMVDIQKYHDTVYICSHIDTGNQKKSVTLVYFLFDDKLHAIAPVPLPLQQIGNLFKGTPLSLLRLPLKLSSKVQLALVHLFSDVTKLSVDRVRITSTEVELFSGGDREQFDDYAFKRIIPLN